MGNNLRTLREKHSLTQEGLEDAAGITQTTISSLERTGRVPGLETARRLADGLSRLAGTVYTVEDLFPPSPRNGDEA